MISTLLVGALLAAPPSVGETAPDFTVSDTEGKSHTLSRLVETSSVLLVFFPKAFTPG